MRTYKTSLLYRALLMAGVVSLSGCNFSNEVAEYQAPEIRQNQIIVAPYQHKILYQHLTMTMN